MSERKEINPIDCWETFLLGNDYGLEALVRAYSDPLVRFAYCFVKDSAVAEDVMEDAFATLVFKRKRFHKGENLRAYLYKIVRNKCVDYLRAHKKQTPLDDVEYVLSAVDNETDLLRRENARTVYTCLQKLPPQYAEVLYLSYFEEYTIDELGRILKRTKKQIYNLLSRAKLSLKELLIKEGISHEDL